MRAVVLILIFLVSYQLDAQVPSHEKGWIVKGQYSHDFIMDGYVRVREWELEGDKMKLKTLGVSNFPALKLQVIKEFSNYKSFTAFYEEFFIRGSATVDSDIDYNGTIIDGTAGVNVASTRYYRFSMAYRSLLLKRDKLVLQFMAGLTYDRINFYIDGPVRSYSPRNEVYERFDRQALPFPELGVTASYILKSNCLVKLDISGSYIPEFKSFYNEGGPMYLHYSNLSGELGYFKILSSWELSAGVRVRSMRIFQESLEDTNDLKLVSAAPFFGLGFKF